MAANARPVFKYTLRGELLDSFPSIRDAAKSVRMDTSPFRELVEENGFLGGYIYSWSGDGIPPIQDDIRDFTKQELWEKNGYFDINGWRKSCLY
jgi:hypothetical protein